MCTVIKLSQKYHPKTAKKEIVVYKVSQTVLKDSFYSMIRYHPYIKDKLYTTAFTYHPWGSSSDVVESTYAMSLRINRTAVFVYNGFHSYISLERVDKAGYVVPSPRIGEFIIPVGAKYYENECGNIVSNQIIFKDYVFK